MSWHKGPFTAFDVESTGVDTENDRVVTAALIEIDPTREPRIRNRDWLINPGVEIPQGAIDVHGITNEQAKKDGAAPESALNEIAALVCAAFRAGRPIVAVNAAFDLTMLDRELIRYNLGGLGERLGGYDAIRPVLDPFVIDRKVDKYRKGKRTLTALCDTYGVPFIDAHTAGADALAGCRVLFKIAKKYPTKVGDLTVDELHDLQIDWHAEKQREFAAYRESIKKPLSDISTEWPLRRLAEGRAA